MNDQASHAIHPFSLLFSSTTPHHITSHHTTPHHTTSHYTTVDLQCRQGHVRHWMQQCRRSSHC